MLLPRRLMNGRALMTNFYFNHDPANLPDFSDDCHPVQMFHTHQNDINKHSLVSKQLLQTVRDLGLNVDADAIDLITIATAITQNTSVSAIADNIESNENTMFIITIIAITDFVDLGLTSFSSSCSILSMCQISFTAVYIIKIPPTNTINE